LVAVVAGGVWHNQLSGLFVAICAKIAATGTEVVYLAWHTSKLTWQREADGASAPSSG